MTTEDAIAKLGYSYQKQRVLAKSNTGTYYTRIDHILRKPGEPDVILRDRGSIELFITSKLQLELDVAPGGPKKK